MAHHAQTCSKPPACSALLIWQGRYLPRYRFFTLPLAFLSFFRMSLLLTSLGIIEQGRKGCFEYDKKRIARVSDYSSPLSSSRPLNYLTPLAGWHGVSFIRTVTTTFHRKMDDGLSACHLQHLHLIMSRGDEDLTRLWTRKKKISFPFSHSNTTCGEEGRKKESLSLLLLSC